MWSTTKNEAVRKGVRRILELSQAGGLSEKKEITAVGVGDAVCGGQGLGL